MKSTGGKVRSTRDRGFTLIELLVVMVIIGIIAAIAIPSFFAQRDKAKAHKAALKPKPAAASFPLTLNEVVMTEWFNSTDDSGYSIAHRVIKVSTTKGSECYLETSSGGVPVPAPSLC